jgi:hypothetical protein
MSQVNWMCNLSVFTHVYALFLIQFRALQCESECYILQLRYLLRNVRQNKKVQLTYKPFFQSDLEICIVLNWCMCLCVAYFNHFLIHLVFMKCVYLIRLTACVTLVRIQEEAHQVRSVEASEARKRSMSGKERPSKEAGINITLHETLVNQPKLHRGM